MSPLFFGLDAASFQGLWDPAAEHAAGLAFGLEKASQGVGYTNPDYTPMVARMRAASLVPGGYHFLDGSGSGAAQAGHYVATLGGDTRVMLALDVEALGQVTRAHVVDWCVEVNRLLPHRDLLIYTGMSFWSQITGGLDIRSLEQRLGVRIWLWDAGDGHRPNIYVPGSGTVAAIWARVSLAGWQPYGGWDSTSRLFLQFTDKATELGVSGGVDGDAFFGTFTQLQALAGAATPTPLEDDVYLGQSPDGSIAVIDGNGKRFCNGMAEVHGYEALGLTVKLIPQVAMNGIPLAPTAPAVDTAALAGAIATVLVPHLTVAAVDVATLAPSLATILVPLLAPGEQAAAEAAIKAVLAKAAA